MDHEARVLAYDIFEVMWELDAANLHIVSKGEVIRDLHTYRELYK